MGVLEDTRISIDLGPAQDIVDAEEEDDNSQDAVGPSVATRAQAALKFLPPKVRCLNVNVQAQQQSLWCWLAVATTIERYFEPSSTLTQCQLANTMLSQSKCCAQPSSAACNQAGDTSAALQQVGHFQSNTTGSLTFFQLKLEIGFAQDPIVVRIKWGNAAVGHAVILSGYLTDSEGDHWVVVDDPGAGTTELWTYDEFRTAYKGNGTWDITRRTQN